MKGLDVPPEEILENIIRNIPHNSLPALGQCSRKFQRLIVPQLYRCVFFDGSNYEYPDTNSLRVFRKWKRSLPICKRTDKYLPPYEPSRIFKLGPFLRSISKSEYLRSLVEVAAFGWFNTNGMTVPKGRDLLRVTTILSYLLPSLQSVSLSAVVPQATIIPFDLNLTSLSLFYDNFGGQSIRMQDLYNLFCIEALRHLTLDGGKFRGIQNKPRWDFSPEDSVSNLTSLSIRRIYYISNILESIIGWPKALEKLDYNIVPDQHWWCSVGHLIYPALRQRESLKELYISTVSDPACPVRGDSLSYDPAENRSFNALKRLLVPLEHLIITSLSMEWQVHLGLERSDFPRLTLYDTIPPGLEELTIECPHETQDMQSRFAHELSSWQKDIWKYHAFYPNLRNIIHVLRNSKGT